jgi:hypothetical protein
MGKEVLVGKEDDRIKKCTYTLLCTRIRGLVRNSEGSSQALPLSPCLVRLWRGWRNVLQLTTVPSNMMMMSEREEKKRLLVLMLMY